MTLLEGFLHKIISEDNLKTIISEELAADMMSLLASFSGKFYGKRSAERRKKNKNDKKVIA